MKPLLGVIILSLLICVAVASPPSREVRVWYDGGLIWYEDPHLLSSEQRRVIEIARGFLERNFPEDLAHRKYGGLIEDAGQYWEVQFTAITIGTEPLDAIHSDLMIRVDKLTYKVIDVTHGQ